MKIYQFTCRLLSDVIMTSDTASEGVKESLDYIPGSKFLGIAARHLYNEASPQRTRDMFHNGKVKFSDAHPLLANERSLPSPFSWYFNKGDSILDKLYLHHDLTPERISELSAKEIQLKQQRSGYFTPKSGYFLKGINQSFSLKSAYDKANRQSKDSQMFGYSGLPKGSEWCFTVSDVTGNYLEEIKNSLTGRQRIGRSRSAEYGLVEISFDEEITLDNQENSHSSKLLLYAASNLCIYNDHGQTTGTPDPVRDFKMPAGSKIDWQLSQVRTRNYQTWNGHRHNRDADRFIIEKGSVFVIQTAKPVSLPSSMICGAHQAEGFGHLLIQPAFLQPQGISLRKMPKDSVHTEDPESQLAQDQEASETDRIIIKMLERLNNTDERYSQIEKEANEFVKTHSSQYRNITSSQWGAIRNYAKWAANDNVLNKLLFEEDFGYLSHGKNAHLWSARNRKGILKDFLNNKKSAAVDAVQLCIRIASEMAKQSKKNKDDDTI